LSHPQNAAPGSTDAVSHGDGSDMYPRWQQTKRGDYLDLQVLLHMICETGDGANVTQQIRELFKVLCWMKGNRMMGIGESYENCFVSGGV
jgi:hypothetical protein